MSDLSERFKTIQPWASTPAERAAALRQRAKMDVPGSDKKKAAAVQMPLKVGRNYP